MTNLTKSVNYWNLSIGKGSQDLLSNLFLKGCIFESDEKLTFFVKDKENNDLSISSILNDNSAERFFSTSTASYEIMKDELCKNFLNISSEKNSIYELASNAVALCYTGAMLGEETFMNAKELNAEFSEESDSAQFNEIYGDHFDEEQNIIVAWSWTYDFLNESKFENEKKNKKLIDIQTELVTPGWNSILEDELKTEIKYNKMVYFKI